jgi:hypothetical protein
MRVKIGKRWVTLAEKKSEANQLRNCKEKMHLLCNENLRLKMELLDARAFNKSIPQKNFAKGYETGYKWAIRSIMRDLNVPWDLDTEKGYKTPDGVRLSAIKKILESLSQECDCDRIEQLCKQLEQVSKERDDALERLHRVNGSLRTLTAETSNEFVRCKCSASVYELKEAVGEPVFLQPVGLTGYWTVLKKYENGAFVFVDRDERECEYGSAWVAYRAENADE